MGFTCICSSVVLPAPLHRLVQIICFARFVITVLLSLVGLGPFPELFQDPIPIPEYSDPSNAPPPICPSVAVKTELPAVEFAEFVRRLPRGSCHEPTCVVCLCWLEARDEVRRLGNCEHAFHRDCIDSWVDAGRVTCPLCRAQLLPCPRRKERARWVQRLKFW